jgi:hypothetical protein
MVEFGHTAFHTEDLAKTAGLYVPDTVKHIIRNSEPTEQACILPR